MIIHWQTFNREQWISVCFCFHYRARGSIWKKILALVPQPHGLTLRCISLTTLLAILSTGKSNSILSKLCIICYNLSIRIALVPPIYFSICVFVFNHTHTKDVTRRAEIRRWAIVTHKHSNKLALRWPGTVAPGAFLSRRQPSESSCACHEATVERSRHLINSILVPE